LSRKPVLLRVAGELAAGAKKRRFDSSLASRPKMILTNCAACARSLAHDAPRCVRCRTRYCKEVKSLLRKTIPVARRVLGDDNILTLVMNWVYAKALYKDDDAAPDDLHESVDMLEDTDRIARRVLGGAHPLVGAIGRSLQNARSVLRARETPPPGPPPINA
jgi:hypothetical protein